MLTVLILLIRRKNPVIAADFTEAKRNRQDVKKVLHSDCYRYKLYGKMPGSIFELFQIT